jgi:hypothetical protein
LELDLPLTGIIGLEELVDLPTFNGIFCESDHRSNEFSHFEKHYASQLALRRLCANLHNDINECTTVSIFTRSVSMNLPPLRMSAFRITDLVCVSNEFHDGNPSRF